MRMPDEHDRRCDLRGGVANGRRGNDLGGNNTNKLAVAAVSRNLFVLPHKLWMSGEVYEAVRNHSAVPGKFAQD